MYTEFELTDMIPIYLLILHIRYKTHQRTPWLPVDGIIF